MKVAFVSPGYDVFPGKKCQDVTYHDASMSCRSRWLASRWQSQCQDLRWWRGLKENGCKTWPDGSQNWRQTLFLRWTTDYHSFMQHPQHLWLSRCVLCSGHLPGAQRCWYFSQDVQGWCAWLIGEHFWCTRELHLMCLPHNLDFWGDFATYLSWFSELFDRIALFPWYYKFSPASCVKSFGSKHVSLTYQASSLVSEGEGATVSYIPLQSNHSMCRFRISGQAVYKRTGFSDAWEWVPLNSAWLQAWCPLPPARDLKHAMALSEQWPGSQMSRDIAWCRWAQIHKTDVTTSYLKIQS